MEESKIDILTALSEYNLENLILQIFNNLSAVDLKCCQMVNSTWNYFVNLALQKLDQKWENDQPSISSCQCDKPRSVCTISALSVDEDGLCVGLGSSGDLGAQSFTLLKADLSQDIKSGFEFSRCLNGTFP